MVEFSAPMILILVILGSHPCIHPAVLTVAFRGHLYCPLGACGNMAINFRIHERWAIYRPVEGMYLE